jgi:hypothetical protein
MLAVKFTAATEAVTLDGIIPIKAAFMQPSGDSEFSHH